MSDTVGVGFDPAPTVALLGYKPGWSFRMGGPGNRALCVFATTPDSQAPDRQRVTQHMFEVPAVESEAEFLRWVLDRLLEAEFHECCEFLAVGERRPFFPNHQDEGSPYVLVDRTET